MSRIQNILEKAEREGNATRTARIAPSVVTAPASTTVSVPVTIDIPTSVEPAIVVPGMGAPAAQSTTAPEIAHHAVRLNPLLVAGLAPKSAAAEQYRALRTRLSLSEGTTALRTVLVTSPQKGEGKSLTAANLALTMAQEFQRRVVIVDADLRKPSLQHLFGLPAGPGLTEYLSGAVELNDAMRYLPDYNLTILPAGTTPMNPAELLGSTAMRRMLDQLRGRFDRVILDTPPVLPLADVAILAPLCDGALMVVRAGVTPKPAIENALRAFDASRLLGVVLNESEQDHGYGHEEPRH